jgi:hypothetical protein|tara:strand:- start:2186 stop:2458 length:273 start_codon:yes stop_codon:yes gene_type:complete
MEGEVSDFDIRDDRPMPSKMSLGSLDYPFDDLDIGQSFVVDAETDEDSNGRRTIENRLRSAAFRYGKKLNKKFTCRFMSNDRKIGVWRTE